MPYKSVEDVPEGVPEAKREQWLKAFNKAWEEGKDLEQEEREKKAKAAADAAIKDTQMADFNSQWIEIFRAGDYGEKGEWTESEIDQVVENFSNGDWRAPAVLGHPEHDSPAMGHVAELKRKGPSLMAKFQQVHPALESMVSEGRYPNRSAAFYTDPQGKGPVLRHVGFLGAVPPEVKGLAPIQFSNTKFISIDFEEETMSKEEQKKTIMEAVREYFGELFGQKKTDGASFSESQVNDIVKKAVTSATAPLIEQNKKLSTQFDELQTTLNASAADAKKAEVTAFIEKLKAAGKWVPAFDVAGIPALLEHAALSGGKVKFGEEGKEKEYSSYEAFCQFLEQVPAIVPTKNITGRVAGKSNVIEFNEAKGIDLDTDSVALMQRAQKIATDRKITYSEALPIAREELRNSA